MRCFSSIFLGALSALPLFAGVLPVNLSAPDSADKGAKDKPVKVYILSGQSNMVGFGRVEGAQPFNSKAFLSADPSVTGCTLPTDSYALMRFGIFQSDKTEAQAVALPGSLAELTIPKWIT